ncbi:MAG TPA: 30S ribosomal protein S2 [Myxococcota bacterium]|nr:30S ribosomal protein S2 [Myxococcota bacterium]
MAETPAPPEAAGANPAPPSTMGAHVERAELTVRDLLEAGVHFGHQTRRWNPRMKRFLFGERNGVHIVDLDQTLPRFQKALDFLRETVASGGKVLFVSTKRQAQSFVEAEAQRCEQYFVSRRWLGGMLTNFKTVRKSIEHYKELLELVADAEKVADLSKKELAGINREVEKYKRSLDGIKEMTRLPDALFIVDVGRESIAVKEANRLGIPIVAIVDSNCDPESIDFVVPGNDDSTRAIQLYCQRVADACAEGARIFNERVQSEVSEQERTRAAGEVAEKTGTGRVVVEIKQQPRRGRGTHSAAPRQDREREPERDDAEAPSAPAPASE